MKQLLARFRGRTVAAFVLAAGFAFGTTVGHANCTPPSGNLESTPDSVLVDNANGTITHTPTGLMWKKCVQGFSDIACATGSPETHNWGNALKQGFNESFAGQTDWRLPSRNELLSIVETACSTPAINPTRFPGTPLSGLFWTGTHAGVVGGDMAWGIRFATGVSELTTKTTKSFVRLVRGGTADESYIGTAPAGGPNAFSFASSGNQTPGATVVSNIVTLAGVTGTPAISVSGGSYRINGGAWVTNAGTVANGNTVQLQVVLANTNPTTKSATVTINGRTASFTASTESLVTTEPNQFAFAAANAAPNTVTTSETKTITGLTQARPISISGSGSPQFSIGGGAWTNTATTISNSQTVAVRLTSGCGTTVNTATLVINTESAPFVVTSTGSPGLVDFTAAPTAALNTLTTSNTQTVSTGICAATPISISGQGTPKYSVGGGAFTATAGTVNPGQTVAVQLTSSASAATAYTATLTIGSQTVNFVVTTADTVPDPFTFTDTTGVALSTLQQSNAITVFGVNAPTPISVVGGQYQINGGAWTSVAGSVSDGQTVAVSHTSSALYVTATNTTVTIGGVSDTFTTTTIPDPASDTIPDPFTFTDAPGLVALSTLTTSNTLTVAGITGPASISVTGGEYQVQGGAFTTTPGTITNGQTFAVRHTSSAAFSTATNTILDIGTITDTFTSTTLAADAVPDAFTFVDQTNVPTGTMTASAPIVVAGINSPAAISIAGAVDSEYQINGGAWTSAVGSVNNGDSVAVHHTSSPSNSTAINTTLTIGGVSDIFTTTTVAPACGTADWSAISFANTTGDRNLTCTTTARAITNLCAGATYTYAEQITAGSGTTGFMDYSINNGTTWLTNPVTGAAISNGANLRFRVRNENKPGTTYRFTVTIGGIAKTWQFISDSNGTACTPP